MISAQRVLHQTTDLSILVNDFRAGAAAFAYQAGQYLYVGSEVPFTNLWIEPKPGAVNALASVASVDLWWGHQWVAAVDVLDTTALAGASLAQAGRLMWQVDRFKGWDIENESRRIDGLSGTYIYDFYWARIAWSANLTPATELNYVGQKFCSDVEIVSYYPDLQNAALKQSFVSTKTTWDEQAYMASGAVVRDLVARNLIFSRGQIIDFSIFEEAACHKVAELVYGALGQAFEENRKSARRAYDEAMKRGSFRIDTNLDGKLEPGEKRAHSSFQGR